MDAQELEKLKQFIIEAHANTYASDSSKPVMPSRPGSTDFKHFNKQGWLYLDSYYGGRRFIGEEIVRAQRDQTIWGMNYYGGVTKEGMDYKPVYSFLKKVLRIGVEDGIPFRGPSYWTTEVFTYESHMDGDLSEFSGEEFIYYKNEIVYYARFHGGLVDEIS